MNGGKDDQEELGSDDRLLVDLMKCYAESMRSHEPDLFDVQENIVRFCVLAIHTTMYHLVAEAREEKLDADEVAAAWLSQTGRMFNDYLMDRDLIREVAEVTGVPEIRLKLSRRFRRRL